MVLAASVVTAVHHLALDAFVPTPVFPDGAGFGFTRVPRQAVILVAEVGVLIWVCETVVSSSTAPAEAEREAQAQVTWIQDSTERTVGAVDGISGRIRDMAGSATAIASAVEEQGAATQEILRNVAAAASASDLSREFDTLTTEVVRFLETMRAA